MTRLPLALTLCAALTSGSATRQAQAIDRAAAWLAAFPVEHLRFDAAVGLAAIRRRIDNDALRTAFERAKSVADRDPDNPTRRAFDESYRAPAKSTSRWEVPRPGQRRVNTNRVVDEALFCSENGLRPETLDYISGPMRDNGGYQTTHGMWALVIARDRGCLSRAEFAKRARPLVDELRSAQPSRPGEAALDADLYAERLLMLVLAGERDPQIDSWAFALLDRQQPDGAFGKLAAAEDPYHGYHATMASLWALAEWNAAR